MIEAKIIDRGRGPEIAGSRITVYDVLDYHKEGWPTKEIAWLFHLSTAQVEAAIRYIEEHRGEVMEAYQRILARHARGNPPELQAKLDAGHDRFLAMVRERREVKQRDEPDAGISADRGEDGVGCREESPQLKAEIMNDAKIIEPGRNPRIAGTRITVYTILEYVQEGWRPDDIAFALRLTRAQVEEASRYIEEHRDEVMAEHAKIKERIDRGNPPELQAKLDAAHERLQAMVRDRRRKGQEAHLAGHSGGQ